MSENENHDESPQDFNENTPSTAAKIFVAIVLFFFVVGASLFYHFYQIYQFDRLPVVAKLQKIWNRDMANLKKSGSFPKEFNSIKEVQYFTGDKFAKAWLPHISAPVELKKEGQYKLEILLVSWQDKKKAGVMIQYDLIDAKSENLVKEFGRTFVLKGEGLQSRITALKKWLSSFPLLNNNKKVLDTDS